MTPAEREDLDPITLARFLSGESDDAEAARVRRWIAADQVNAELVAQLREAWVPGASKDEAWDVEGAWRRMRPHLGSESSDRAEGIQLVPRRPSIMPIASRTSPRWRAPVALAAALLLAVALWRVGPVRPVPAHDPAAVEQLARAVATRAGERAEITLGDGIDVVLAPDSRLRYSAGLEGSQRWDVYLEGEAFFRVRHDSTRQFVVHTTDAMAEDLGTEFSVRRYLGEPATRVVVGEGHVSLRGLPASGAARPAQLSAGDLGSVGGDGRLPVVERVNAQRYFAWKDGWLVFHHAELSSVASDLSRWYDIDIAIADSALLRRHLEASFKAATADDALHIVATSLGATIERHGRHVVISPKRSP